MIRAAFSQAHDQIDEMLREFLSMAHISEDEESSSLEANGGSVWKKKLDILSKILTVPEINGINHETSEGLPQ